MLLSATFCIAGEPDRSGSTKTMGEGMKNPVMLRALTTACAFGVLLPVGDIARAAGVIVTDAKIQSGRLIVTGRTPAPNQQVKLDNLYLAKSNATKVFSFNITNYLPSDCIVDLRAGTASGSGVVANCAGWGLVPRGAWGANPTYLVNDLVTYQGSTWRALRRNINKGPASNPADWVKFAAKGDIGPKGPVGLTGPVGPTGATGVPGPAGAPGTVGPAGSIGSAGPQGIPGPSGPGITARGLWADSVDYAANELALFDGSAWRALRPNTSKSPAANPLDWELFAARGDTGETGAAGPQGPIGETGSAGAQGLQGDVGPQGLTGDTGETGAAGPQGPIGEIGPAGLQGEVGPQGLTGDTGETGAVGPQGPIGETGSAGAQGLQGDVGPQGLKGDKGETGDVLTGDTGRWDRRARSARPAQRDRRVPSARLDPQACRAKSVLRV